MGMRASGSQNVRIAGLFISDRAIIARRPSGKWHPLYHVAVMVATPLIFSVYLGLAMSARDEAVTSVKRRGPNDDLIGAVGAMEAHLNVARMAIDDMLSAASDAPGEGVTNRVELARTVAGDACIATVQAAVELVGGAAFMRDDPLESMFRDVQAARFHPMTRLKQLQLAGRLALGLAADAQ
jgi:acyl-CoA dehydrogenase